MKLTPYLAPTATCLALSLFAACGPMSNNTNPTYGDPNQISPSGTDPNGTQNPNQTQNPNRASNPNSTSGNPNAPTSGFFAATLANPTNPNAQDSLMLVLSSDPNFCTNVGKHTATKNSTEVEVKVSSATPVAQGTFTIPGDATATVLKLNAQCGGTPQPVSAGTLDLKTVSTTALSGTLAVTVGTTPMNSTFQATSCPALVSTGTAGNPNTVGNPNTAGNPNFDDLALEDPFRGGGGRNGGNNGGATTGGTGGGTTTVGTVSGGTSGTTTGGTAGTTTGTIGGGTAGTTTGRAGGTAGTTTGTVSGGTAGTTTGTVGGGTAGTTSGGAGNPNAPTGVICQ